MAIRTWRRGSVAPFGKRLTNDRNRRLQEYGRQKDAEDQVWPARAGQPDDAAGRGDRETLNEVVAGAEESTSVRLLPTLAGTIAPTPFIPTLAAALLT